MNIRFVTSNNYTTILAESALTSFENPYLRKKCVDYIFNPYSCQTRVNSEQKSPGLSTFSTGLCTFLKKSRCDPFGLYLEDVWFLKKTNIERYLWRKKLLPEEEFYMSGLEQIRWGITRVLNSFAIHSHIKTLLPSTHLTSQKTFEIDTPSVYSVAFGWDTLGDTMFY